MRKRKKPAKSTLAPTTPTPTPTPTQSPSQRLRYEVIMSKRAGSEFARLHPDYKKAFDKIIVGLAEQPRPYNAEKMKGAKGYDQYRIRVRDFRLVYDVKDDKVIVLILHISPRGEVYKVRRRGKR